MDLFLNRLAKEGYDVFSCPSGAQSLQMIHEIRPNLLLLDFQLQSMPVAIILEEISKDNILRKIPIIAIVNSAQDTDLSAAKELGVVDFFIKTVDSLQELVEKVAKAARK